MLAQAIAILTSVITLASMWMAGNEKAFGWILGMLNQVIWFVFILVFGAWGLLPLNIALVFVYGRNYYKWKTEDDYITFVEHIVPVNMDPIYCTSATRPADPKPNTVIYEKDTHRMYRWDGDKMYWVNIYNTSIDDDETFDPTF